MAVKRVLISIDEEVLKLIDEEVLKLIDEGVKTNRSKILRDSFFSYIKNRSF